MIDGSISLKEAASETCIANLFRSNLSLQVQMELQTLQAHITATRLQEGRKDEIIWSWTEAGTFTVKFAYKALKNLPRVGTSLSKIWKIKVPPRIQTFAWLANQDKILTHDNLQKRGWALVSRCSLCKSNVETTSYLFQNFPYMLQLYSKLKLKRLSDRWPAQPTIEIANEDKVGRLDQVQIASLLIMLFVLWRERCPRTFTDSCKSQGTLLEETFWKVNFYDQRRAGALAGEKPIIHWIENRRVGAPRSENITTGVGTGTNPGTGTDRQQKRVIDTG